MRNTDRLMYEQKKVKKGERGPVFQPVPEAQKKPDEVLEGYRSRIHKIFSQFDKCTYFYMDYLNFKWYIIENDHMPKCLKSSSVGPLRAIWLSGAVHPDDKLIYESFCRKIKNSFDDKITDSSLNVNIRLCEGDKPVRYLCTAFGQGR